jgi:RHS repeat-associated protein
VIENGVRKTYSARYYNPNSGRFMSRDPEDGKAKDPKTLHKYLYAGGDPINAVDPTGKGIIEYVWTNVRSAALGVLEGHKYGEIVLCLLQFVNDRMLAVYLGLPFSGVGMPDWDLQACLELAGML